MTFLTQRRTLLLGAIICLLAIGAVLLQGCGANTNQPRAGDRGFKGLQASGDADGTASELPTDVPVPGDAQNVVTAVETMQFDSPNPAPAVRDYFLGAMASSGWKLSQAPQQQGSKITIIFVKADRSAIVNIDQVESNRSHVTVSMGGV